MLDRYKILNPYLSRDGNFLARISGVCPHCFHSVLFDAIGLSDKVGWQTGKQPNTTETLHSIRRCPRRECFGVVFIISELYDLNQQPRVLEIFPKSKIPIETEGYPDMIVSLLNEAIDCFGAGCYRSSAIMVRRVVEEICKEFGAQGHFLAHKLDDLKTKIQIPETYHDGLKSLRVLGNDAAHVELKDFDQVDREEVNLAIDLIQEILRIMFKHRHLNAQLQARMKQK